METICEPVKCSMVSSSSQTGAGSTTGAARAFHQPERAKIGVSRQPRTFLMIG